jgi:uncharacterized protein (TIGR03663 family)
MAETEPVRNLSESPARAEARAATAAASSALDRKFLGNLTLEQCVYIAVFVIAVFTRLYILGARPYHHDESIHAFFSWKITTDGVGSYQYDPVYHGPLLYYSTAAVLAVFGDSDFTGRLSAVLYGLGVLAFAWPLRRYLGRWSALWFLILVTFSPAMTYFTRFIRHDIFVAFGNLMAVYFAFRYAETRAARNLYVSAVGLAIAFCNKEDMYALAPVFIIAAISMLVWEVVYAQDWRATLRAVTRETVDLLKKAMIPLITSAIIFVTIWLVFYTSFFTHPKNWNAVTKALSYWWGQHEIKRIGGPWWYYFPQLVVYEPLLFFPAILFVLGPFLQPGPRQAATRILGYLTWAGLVAFAISLVAWPAYAPLVLLGALTIMGVTLMRRWLPDRFTRFLIVWTLGSFCFYSWAQEKVPWLLVPILLPTALLAAKWFGQLVESKLIQRPATALPLAAVGALTLWSLIAVNYLYDAPHPSEAPGPRHAELLAYVQSTYDITDVVMKRIDAVSATLGTGTQTRLAVTGNATWPLSWYLRHYPVNWSADVRQVDTPVVIVDREATNALDKALADKYDKINFQIRGWWETDWKLLNVPNLVHWLLTREAFNGVGSSDAVMYVAKDLKPGTTFAPVAVNPPPAARGYPAAQRLIAPVAVWGQKGTGAAQFDEPRGLGVDTGGNIYVVDSKNNRIQKLSPDGKPLLAWGKEGAEPGNFKDPCGVTVGPDDAIYVADTWNHRVQKFDSNGHLVGTEWRAQTGFWGPRGIAIAPDGKTVYVTDTGNKRVVSFDASGKELTSWGHDGSKPGEFIEPVGIAVDQSGQVFVADTGNHRVQVFDGQGKFLREFPMFGWDEFYTEPYLAMLGSELLTTDSFNHRCARYADGTLVYSWGKSGTDKGDFNRPIGIATDAKGAVYVSDTMNHRIQKFELPPTTK